MSWGGCGLLEVPSHRYFLGSFKRPVLTLGVIFQASPGRLIRRWRKEHEGAAEAQGEVREGVSDAPPCQLSHLPHFGQRYRTLGNPAPI